MSAPGSLGGVSVARPKGVADIVGVSAVRDAGSAETRGEGDEGQEASGPRRVADPLKPSAREAKEHELTHLVIVPELVLDLRTRPRK